MIDVKRWSVAAAGGLVTLLGVALLVLPGPALVVIPIGLSILATQFEWARKLLHRFHDYVEQLGRRWRARRRRDRSG